MNVDNQYVYCTYDPVGSILYHDVTDENFSNEEMFINSMSQFITLVDKYRPKALIIRVYKIPDYHDRLLKSFMKGTFYKVAINLNIKKIAFFVQMKEYIPVLEKHPVDNPFKIKFFDDLEEAKKWVLS